jgi:hypothetical protein
MFARLDGVEAREGLATAEYWSGDYRAAARDFRRVLALDPQRELARQSLAEIMSTAVPSQRITIAGTHDDQPLDLIRNEVAATFFSDPQTRWTATLGRYAGDANGTYASVANQTTVKNLTIGGSLGLFTFPDGVRRPIGDALIRRGSLSLRVQRQPELASVPSLTKHVASTTTALRWDYDRNWLAAAEVSDRRYSDDNRGYAVIAYALVPLRRKGWTFWSGVSGAIKDTGESRFSDAGQYDPYWTPEDFREGRLVVGVERANVKLHADGGSARDRGRAYHPWRTGVSANFALAGDFRIEAGIERSSTIDYRVTSFHAALVRRH